MCFPTYDLLFPRQARVTAYEKNTLGCLEAGHVLCSTGSKEQLNKSQKVFDVIVKTTTRYLSSTAGAVTEAR